MSTNNRVAPGATDICPCCKKEVEVLTGKIYKKKVYHPDCYLKMIKTMGSTEQKKVGESEIKLLKYVAKLFALPSVSVKLRNEIDGYLERGMTYDSLYLTLHYVYDILQWDFPSYLSYPTLKVIDYKYDEAMDFWNKKSALEEKSKEYTFEHTTVVNGKPRQKSNTKQEKDIELIDLDTVVTQFEEQEQLNKEKEIEEAKQRKELEKYRQDMLSIQKDFEKKEDII